MDSVTICNMALMAAGIPAITSFDEENNNAKLCKSFYPLLRDRVLRDHEWSFATAYFDLPTSEEQSPDEEYGFVCYLPADVIRVIGLSDGSDYRRIGNKILVKNHPVRLQYVKRVEDPNVFDVSFIEALQNLLSSEIVLSSTRDIQLAQHFRNEYEKKLAVARSIDSSENYAAHQPAGKESSFLAARRGYGISSKRVVFVHGNAGKQG